MSETDGESIEQLADRLAAAPIFDGLSVAEIGKLVEIGRVVDARSGDTVYAVGDPSDTIYVVIQGRLRLTARDESLAYVGRLDTIGHVSALADAPRGESARAVRDSRLLALDVDEYFAFLEAHPRRHRRSRRPPHAPRSGLRRRPGRASRGLSRSFPAPATFRCACWPRRWSPASTVGRRRG